MPLTIAAVSKPHHSCLRLLDRIRGEHDVHIGAGAGEFAAGVLLRADVILNVMSGKDAVRGVWLASPKVRWFHSMSAGVESSLFPELVESGVPLTNGRGVFSRSLAEFVVAGALYFEKQVPYLQKLHREGRWENIEVMGELHGKTMGIISYGTIGKETARLAHAFGMRVLATRRRPDLEADPWVERFYGVDGMIDMVRESDFVVVTSPHTPETHRFVSAAVISAMKPDAVFMNVGRGQVVDEPALIEALNAGRIRGAALDVFETEPLPPGHPMFAVENLLLSPHSADHTPGWTENAMEFFLENLGRFVKGETLENIVDKRAGY